MLREVEEKRRQMREKQETDCERLRLLAEKPRGRGEPTSNRTLNAPIDSDTEETYEIRPSAPDYDLIEHHFGSVKPSVSAVSKLCSGPPRTYPAQPQTRFKPDKYLISRVKEFSGERGENLENYFYSLERYFINDQCPEDYKITIASDHLTKNALETYKMISKEIDLTWPELKEILIDKFQPTDYQAALRRELTNLKQDKSSNVREYIYEFEKLMN